jgi:hypothetical protein
MNKHARRQKRMGAMNIAEGFAKNQLIAYFLIL